MTAPVFYRVTTSWYLLAHFSLLCYALFLLDVFICTRVLVFLMWVYILLYALGVTRISLIPVCHLTTPSQLLGRKVLFSYVWKQENPKAPCCLPRNWKKWCFISGNLFLVVKELWCYSLIYITHFTGTCLMLAVLTTTLQRRPMLLPYCRCMCVCTGGIGEWEKIMADHAFCGRSAVFSELPHPTPPRAIHLLKLAETFQSFWGYRLSQYAPSEKR